MEKQLSAQEVAALLSISLRTLEKLISAGEAPPYYWVGRSRRWEPAIVRTWIAQRYGADCPPPEDELTGTSSTTRPG